MNQAQLNSDINQIAKLDKDVKDVLGTFGYPAPRVRPQGFDTFLSTIVGQQISTEAAAAIMSRIRRILPELTEQALLDLPAGALREAGLSGRKVEYAQGLASEIIKGNFDIQGLTGLSDEAAIESIASIRGFGAWSAEIYLMFCLQRRDIFPSADLALQVSLQKLKKLEHRPSPLQARKLIEHWSPYRSAGSLFLWHYYRGAPT